MTSEGDYDLYNMVSVDAVDERIQVKEAKNKKEKAPKEPKQPKSSKTTVRHESSAHDPAVLAAEEEARWQAEQDAYEKTEMLDRIGAYKERFKQLKSRNKVSGKSSYEEVADELHYIEVQLGQGDTNNAGCLALIGLCYGAEALTNEWNPLNLRLQGLGATVKENTDQFESVVDELMIKYGASLYVCPEMRLAMLLSATVLTVHATNSGDAGLAVALDKMNGMNPGAKKEVDKKFTKL